MCPNKNGISTFTSTPSLAAEDFGPNLVRVKSVEFVALKKALDFSILDKF